MIQKYVFGSPIKTDAVIADLPVTDGVVPYGTLQTQKGFSFSYSLDKDDAVYGLGESNRGINKRGFLYVSDCTDDPNQTEDRISLYGAHNFLIVSGKETFGLFLDYPSTITFDIGYTHIDELHIFCQNADLDFYVITGDSLYAIVKEFRHMIGQSYIPPKFAFGYGQSRWGYKTAQDFMNVAKKHREQNIPLDMIYMDIDYMDHYKDFTVDPTNFPDFKGFVDDMKKEQIHLIPIIDAGVKIEKGYDIYEEGIQHGYFCKQEDGTEFCAAVWPGMTHFPDVLNSKARQWFGDKYKCLLDAGIEGFWNDMNEPAIFYSAKGKQDLYEHMTQCCQHPDSFSVNDMKDHVLKLQNNPDDYQSFYHNMDGEMIRHDKVHNLYGCYMTRAAQEAFQRLRPNQRILLFSRSSYIGMHRYGGIWTGDNQSWWSHILLNLKMLPSLNMCGFLYVGADLGGFGSHATEDLLLRWLALGIFTPLMRNHSALGTREQEYYQFDHIDDFRHIIGVRYRLIPYLYSEYLKAALNDDMLFKPLSFEYPNDTMARSVEDQLMFGNEIMIAPVYTQNAPGRYVYLPEDMVKVTFLPNGIIEETAMSKGHHYISVALNEVVFFLKKEKKIPIVDVAQSVDTIDMQTLRYIGNPAADYELYE